MGIPVLELFINDIDLDFMNIIDLICIYFIFYSSFKHYFYKIQTRYKRCQFVKHQSPTHY